MPKGCNSSFAGNCCCWSSLLFFSPSNSFVTRCNSDTQILSRLNYRHVVRMIRWTEGGSILLLNKTAVLVGLAWITAIMSKWEKITPRIAHQKNPKKPWNRRQVENDTDLSSHTQKRHNTRRILQLNFKVFIYLHTSVLQLYGSIAQICPSSSRLATNLAWMIAQQTNLHCFCNSPALNRWPTKHQFILLSTVFFKHTLTQSFPVVTHLSLVSVWAPHYFHDTATPSSHRDLISSLCSLHIFLLFPWFWPVLEPFWGQQVGNIAGHGLLAHSCFDIISIWTAKANQAAEMKQGKLRCLQAFHNKGRKQGCRGARQWMSLHTPLTLSPPHTHTVTALKCFLTQKCQEIRLHLQ